MVTDREWVMVSPAREVASFFCSVPLDNSRRKVMVIDIADPYRNRRNEPDEQLKSNVNAKYLSCPKLN